jgi:hypothetical protein
MKLRLCVAPLAALLPGSAWAQWRVNILHVDGFTKTDARGTDGSYVVGDTYHLVLEDDEPSPRLWRPQGDSIDITPPGGRYTHVGQMRGGQIGGYALFSDITRAGYWTVSQNPSWTDLNPTGAVNSFCETTDGEFQGGAYELTSHRDRACLWHGSASSIVDLQPAGAYSSVVWKTDAGLQLGAVTSVSGGPQHAALWHGSAETWQDLNPSGFTSSIANAMDGLHQYGRVSDGNPFITLTAAMWSGTAATYVSMNPAGATRSTISDAVTGFEVGGADFGAGFHVGIWTGTAGSFYDLHDVLPPGYETSSAGSMTVVNDTLYVCGVAYAPYGTTYDAVVWSRPVPEPASCILLGTGALLVTRRLRRRHALRIGHP